MIASFSGGGQWPDTQSWGGIARASWPLVRMSIFADHLRLELVGPRVLNLDWEVRFVDLDEVEPIGRNGIRFRARSTGEWVVFLAIKASVREDVVRELRDLGVTIATTSSDSPPRRAESWLFRAVVAWITVGVVVFIWPGRVPDVLLGALIVGLPLTFAVGAATLIRRSLWWRRIRGGGP